MPSQVLTKKCKRSNLNSVDAGIIITAMEVFLSLINENDDNIPPELIPALEKLHAKMEIVPVHMTAFDIPHYPYWLFLAYFIFKSWLFNTPWCWSMS